MLEDGKNVSCERGKDGMKKWIALWMFLLCMIPFSAQAGELQGDFMMLDGLTFDSDMEDFQNRLGEGTVSEGGRMEHTYHVFTDKLDGLDADADVLILLTSDNKPAYFMAYTELPAFETQSTLVYSPAGAAYTEMEKRGDELYGSRGKVIADDPEEMVRLIENIDAEKKETRQIISAVGTMIKSLLDFEGATDYSGINRIKVWQYDDTKCAYVLNYTPSDNPDSRLIVMYCYNVDNMFESAMGNTDSGFENIITLPGDLEWGSSWDEAIEAIGDRPFDEYEDYIIYLIGEEETFDGIERTGRLFFDEDKKLYMMTTHVEDTDGTIFDATCEAFGSIDSVVRLDDNKAKNVAGNFMDNPDRSAIWLTGGKNFISGMYSAEFQICLFVLGSLDLFE